MDNHTKNKATVSKQTMQEFSRYVLGAIPVIARVDMTQENIIFYDQIGKYAPSATPVIINSSDIEDEDQ